MIVDGGPNETVKENAIWMLESSVSLDKRIESVMLGSTVGPATK